MCKHVYMFVHYVDRTLCSYTHHFPGCTCTCVLLVLHVHVHDIHAHVVLLCVCVLYYACGKLVRVIISIIYTHLEDSIPLYVPLSMH